MIMKKILFAVFAALSLVCSAQTSKGTEERVNALKSAIPYPKHNIGDTLFIAFINDPDVAVGAVRPADVSVIKVRIVEMMLYNMFGGKDFRKGVYLDSPVGEFPLKWQYQFVDASLSNPKYGDGSEFYDENRFFTNPEAAAASLVNRQ